MLLLAVHAGYLYNCILPLPVMPRWRVSVSNDQYRESPHIPVMLSAIVNENGRKKNNIVEILLNMSLVYYNSTT